MDVLDPITHRVNLGTIQVPSAGRAFDGDIGEVSMYDHAFSLSERNEHENYLSNKWGIALP